MSTVRPHPSYVTRRNAVRIVRGADPRPVVFSHGFGCHQGVWSQVIERLQCDRTLVLIDFVGAGSSDVSLYCSERYATLDGYARDLVDLLEAFDWGDVTLVGHSVGATIAMLASLDVPERLRRLVLVAPSPCYMNVGDYHGGFEPDDLRDLVDALRGGVVDWARALAPAVMGNAERPELARELADDFCRYDPDILQEFAHVTFLSDHREIVPRVGTRATILQCCDDAIAPESVGRFLHAAMADSELVRLAATGHCPQVSAPDELAARLRDAL